MNKTTTNVLVNVFWWTYVPISLGYIASRRIARAQGRHIFSFIRYFQTVFHCGLYQCTLPPVMCDFSLFLIPSIFGIVCFSFFLFFKFQLFWLCMQYLKVILVCISLLTIMFNTFFHILADYLHIFFYELLIQIFCISKLGRLLIIGS